MDEDFTPGSRRYSAPRTAALSENPRKPISHEGLREHAFFKGRDPKFLDFLFDSVSVEIFLPGVDIITEGSDGDSMYFLYKGKVEVVVGPDCKSVAILKDGDLFGELALLGNGKRAATIRAAELCDCRVITAATFQTCLKRFPAERAFFQQLAKDRLAELKQTGPDTSSQSPPSMAVGKFRRAAQAIVASEKIKAVSEPASRTTACADSVMASADQVSPCSQMTSTDDTPANSSGASTGQERPAMSLRLPPYILKFVDPTSLPNRRVSTARRSSTNRENTKPMRLGMAKGTCPPGDQVPSTSRRSSTNRENSTPKRLDMTKGMCPPVEQIPSRRCRAPNNQRSSSHGASDRGDEAADRKRSLDATRSHSNETSNGRRQSDSSYCGTKRTVATKILLDTNAGRAPPSQAIVTEILMNNGKLIGLQ